MKRFALAAILTVSLVMASAALGAGGLTGTYNTKITRSRNFNGIWTLQFTKKGALKVKHNGGVAVTGTFSSTGTTITFPKGEEGEGACPSVGRYKWTLVGKHLTFTRISDSCAGRHKVLGYTYTKVG